MSECSVNGCQKVAYRNGMCSMHFQRLKKYGTTDDYLGCHGVKRVCSVDGCGGAYEAKGLCDKHYQRFKKYGSPEGGPANHAPVESRFWRYVDTSGDCWLWAGGSVNKKGYGQIQTGGKGSKHVLAHRLSYEMHHGVIPDGMVVMHKCDNPSCVNPDHLRVGTQSENIIDAMTKGRKVLPDLPRFSGENHPSSKLTAENVKYIQTCGKPTKELAAQFGVALSTVIRARNGRSWKQPNG